MDNNKVYIVGHTASNQCRLQYDSVDLQLNNRKMTLYYNYDSLAHIVNLNQDDLIKKDIDCIEQGKSPLFTDMIEVYLTDELSLVGRNLLNIEKELRKRGQSLWK